MAGRSQFIVAARPEVRVCDGTEVRNDWADRRLLDWNGSSRTCRLSVGKAWKESCLKAGAQLSRVGFSVASFRQ